MKKLPYSFDLLWDFKTVEQLHDHLTGRQRYATSATDFELITLAQELNVPLPEGISAEPPFAITLKERAARVPETATHYRIAQAFRNSGGYTVLYLEFYRQAPSGEWQRFSTDGDDEYPDWTSAMDTFKTGLFETRIIKELRVLEGN